MLIFFCRCKKAVFIIRIYEAKSIHLFIITQCGCRKFCIQDISNYVVFLVLHTALNLNMSCIEPNKYMNMTCIVFNSSCIFTIRSLVHGKPRFFNLSGHV